MKIEYKFLNKHESNASKCNIIYPNQTHSNNAIIISNLGNYNLINTDAIITKIPNIKIGIYTADCLPIVFFDRKNEIIAIAHAGWRGAKSGIIENTISKMHEIGAEKIDSVIGPSISQESYEISMDFYEDFLSEDVNNKCFFKPGVINEKFFFDLKSFAKSKLAKSGIRNINDIDINTYKDRSFSSYRYNTHQNLNLKERNISYITLEN